MKVLMFKRADVSDIGGIVAFEVDVMNLKLYGRPVDENAATSEVRLNEYYLRFVDGHIAATGAVRRRSDGCAYLSSIAVHPARRRQGLARAMMLHLLSRCSDATSVDLVVHPDNEPARGLYASLGFVPTHVRENFFGDGEPRLIMVRSQRRAPKLPCG